MPIESNITFLFSCNGEELFLDGKEFGILDYSGLEATDYELERNTNVNYIGAKKKRKTILPRPISVSFVYRGPEQLKAEKRQELIRFFDPLSSGDLTVNFMGTERNIKYELIGFELDSKNVYDELSCMVELECMDPAFLSTITESQQISTWIGGWKWKFTLPFRMRQRGEKKVNIYNDGHLSCPVEILFHGPAVNPCVKNLRTGEAVKVNRQLTSDETLHINTAFRQKSVKIENNGRFEDAFHAITMDTRFFQLEPGDNMIEYSTDNEHEVQNVVIKYRKRYRGV